MKPDSPVFTASQAEQVLTADLGNVVPAEVTDASTAPPLDPKAKVLKATPEISAGAKLTQKIIESMDLRRQERARLVADGNSKQVIFQRETHEDQKAEEQQIATWRTEFADKVAALQATNKSRLDYRRDILGEIAGGVDRIDLTLANFRKQLDAELAKLDPEREGGK